MTHVSGSGWVKSVTFSGKGVVGVGNGEAISGVAKVVILFCKGTEVADEHAVKTIVTSIRNSGIFLFIAEAFLIKNHAIIVTSNQVYAIGRLYIGF
jgi:hypothetical protein